MKRNNIFRYINLFKNKKNLKAIIKKPKQPVLKNLKPDKTKE